MTLKPDTIAANRARQWYGAHTLAPDPEQGELQLSPRERCETRRMLADMCPRCHSLHLTTEARRSCMDNDPLGR